MNETLTVTFSNSSEYCIDEFSYYHRCNKPNVFFTNPNIQGALYIENCHTQAYCFGAPGDEFLLKKNLNSTEKVALADWHARPFRYESTLVRDNDFVNN